jgi:alpha-1,3-rhamnosyl/mannosyltransferase
MDTSAGDPPRTHDPERERLASIRYALAVLVGFDCSPLHRPHPRGIVRVTRSLVSALERRAKHEIVRLVPPDGASLASWRQRDVPRTARDRELALIHSCLSAFPWRGPGARVQTVHELPWKHGASENADLRHRAWAALGSWRADRVITATEHVARDLRAQWLALGARVRVCAWGVDAEFRDEPPPDVVDEVVLGRYRLPQSPLALCLGAVRAKKNLAAVLRGLDRLRRRNGPLLQLVVSGADTHDLRQDLGLASRLSLARFVSTPGEIADEDLPSLYRLASVVPVLSLSEGFGLPVLEAMACGTPVLVPNDSAQAEVAGPLGIRVDASDPDSVADGLERALAERESLRPKLPERARELTWDRCAAQVEAIWDEIA